MFKFWKKKDAIDQEVLITRKILIEGVIDDKFANDVVKKMIMLEEDSVSEDIKLYIRANTASISAIFTIQDNIKHLKAPVAIFGEGSISGLSIILLSMGIKGKRYAYTNCTIDFLPITKIDENLNKEDEAYLVSMSRKIYDILHKNTGQPYYKIENDCENSLKLNAINAKSYGIVDHVI